MSATTSAALFAALVDVLNTDGPGLVIPVSTNRVYQMQPEANGEKPYIVIHLPEAAQFLASKWSASGNRVDTHFTALVSITCEVSKGVPHALGDATTPGPLNLTESVINAIENARGAFIAAAGELVDMTIIAGASWKADAGVMTTTINVDFWTRGTAGSR